MAGGAWIGKCGGNRISHHFQECLICSVAYFPIAQIRIAVRDCNFFWGLEFMVKMVKLKDTARFLLPSSRQANIINANQGAQKSNFEEKAEEEKAEEAPVKNPVINKPQARLQINHYRNFLDRAERYENFLLNEKFSIPITDGVIVDFGYILDVAGISGALGGACAGGNCSPPE
jgi:hypothetical protein